MMRNEVKKRKEPDLSGSVWSVAAIDFVSADGVPYFTFTIYRPDVPPKRQFTTLYFDLNKRGAHAVVSIVCAAYSVQTVLDVFLEKSTDPSKRVSSVQASKPPKVGAR
jgi:hypothetical protein